MGQLALLLFYRRNNGYEALWATHGLDNATDLLLRKLDELPAPQQGIREVENAILMVDESLAY